MKKLAIRVVLLAIFAGCQMKMIEVPNGRCEVLGFRHRSGGREQPLGDSEREQVMTKRQKKGGTRLIRLLTVLLLLVALAGCSGGGGDDVDPMPETTPEPELGTPDGDIPPGSRAPYSVSINDGSFSTTPVTVSADAVTIGNQTIRLDAVTQVGSQPGHHRVFDTPGATSGPALEIRVFGQSEGYDHIQFGAWAEGVVSPNPGFRIGETYGAFLTPNSASELTPVSNVPVAGTGTWMGDYAGYVDREGVGVSQVAGVARVNAVFGQSGVGDGNIVVELFPPDPDRSSFAALPPEHCVFDVCVPLEYLDWVSMVGPIEGNGFESDPAATRTIAGQTFPRGDAIEVASIGTSTHSLYSQGRANSGRMQGGFFGTRAGEAGGIYQFTVGTTKAAGAFGGKLQ